MVQAKGPMEEALTGSMSEDVRARAARKLDEILDRAEARGARRGSGPRAQLRHSRAREANILREEVERAVDEARRVGLPVSLEALLNAIRSRGDTQTSADQALQALIDAAGHSVAIEVDRH
jgi:hypothetical protein